MEIKEFRSKSCKRSLLVTLFAVCLFAFSIQALASTKSNALKAYDNYLKSQPSSPGFAIIYLNNDAIPELVYGRKIFTYKPGKMLQLDYNYYGPYYYFKKKNILIGSFSHSDRFSSSHTDVYFKLEGMKLNWFLSVDEETPKGKKTETFYKDANSNVISKAQFQSKLKKEIGTLKKIRIQLNENNTSNRKKYLK